MPARTQPPPEFAQLRARVDQWRRTRTRRGRMPEALWAEATSLARRFGVCPVSRAAGLGYGSLQRRVRPQVDLRRPTSDVSAAAPTTFVELSGADLVGGRSHSEGSGIAVELIDPDGARLVFRLPSGSTQELVALVRAFRSAAA